MHTKLTIYKWTKNRLKLRLFHDNAMRPKGAYFARYERLNLTALAMGGVV